MKVLFIEDDPGIGRVVSRGLVSEGYEVAWLQTARDALASLRDRLFTAVILDLGLPDRDGLALCADLRAEGIETPVLMLTARETLEDRLDGFRAGADDYLSKPFAFEELVARLNVLVRRGRSLQEQTLAVGSLQLDLRGRRAQCAGEPLELSKREFDVLAGLAERAGAVVSRAELLDAVWGEEAPLTDNTIDVYVGYLRRRLGGLARAPWIETVRGVGFRLVPPPSED